MGFSTEIGWCDCTFNGWIGCAKVSRGCRFCYAETQERRWHPATDGRRNADVWGRAAGRRRTTAANWRKPHAWNKQAAVTGVPLRVFSASLADVFEDHPDLPSMRADLFHLIEETPQLRWMLLTKRIDMVAAMTAEAWGRDWPGNVWLGTSVEGQREADDRLPVLLDIKGPAERFVSAEPLLEPVVIGGHLAAGRYPLSLLIIGGESGRKARPMHPEWALSLIEANDVPAYFKQHGEFTSYMPTLPDPTSPNGRTFDYDRQPSLWLNRDTAKVAGREADVPPTGSWMAMYRVGKTRSGRLLEGRTYDGVVRSWAAEIAATGREWSEYPQTRTAAVA